MKFRKYNRTVFFDKRGYYEISVFEIMHVRCTSILYMQASEKDVNETISGWVFGVFALVQFLTSPIFGRLVSMFSYMSVFGRFFSVVEI